MRAPPPLRYTLARDRAWMAVQLVLLALAAGVLGWWVGGHLIDDNADGAFMLRLAITGIAAAAGLGGGWRLAAHRGGELAWDGRQWTWLADGAPAARVIDVPQIMIDLEGWMLLRWRGPPPARARAWHAARRGTEPAAWARLRAALYSCGTPNSPPSTPERPPS